MPSSTMVTPPDKSCSSSTSCGANCESTPLTPTQPNPCSRKQVVPTIEAISASKSGLAEITPTHPATRYVTCARFVGEHRFAQITAASGICECEQLQQHSGRLDPSTRAPFAKKQVPCLVMHHQGRGLQLLQPRSIHLEIAGFASIFPEAAARS